MTCIVAVSDGKRVCMACDSRAVRNGSYMTAAEPKITRIGSLLIGADGNLMAGEFLRRHWRPDAIVASQSTDDLAHYVSHQLVPLLWEWWAKRQQIEDGVHGKKEAPSNLIVARGGEMFEVDATGCIFRYASPFMAIGSGSGEAMGAMWSHRDFIGAGDTSDDAAANTETVARTGVEAACALDSGCGPPVVVEWTEP